MPTQKNPEESSPNPLFDPVRPGRDRDELEDTRSQAAKDHQERFPRPDQQQPGGPLLRSYLAYDQHPDGQTLLAFGSDFFGTKLFVPVAHRDASGAVTQLVSHGFEELHVVEAAFSEEEARSLWEQIRPDEEVPDFAGLFGSELAELAFRDTSFGASGITGIVVDPMDTGMLIRPEDETMQFPLRNGALRAAVLAGKEAAMEVLAGAGEAVLMTQRVAKGEREGVALLKNKESGAAILPVFSSTLEVFRHNPEAGSAMVPLEKIRKTLTQDMGLVLDPASPEAIELPPEDLKAAGYLG